MNRGCAASQAWTSRLVRREVTVGSQVNLAPAGLGRQATFEEREELATCVARRGPAFVTAGADVERGAERERPVLDAMVLGAARRPSSRPPPATPKCEYEGADKLTFD
jgi:hypothetical protein